MEESLSDSNAEESSGGYWSLFTNWPLMSAITVYCLFSLQDVAYAEVFSLWAVSDRKYGGLNFTSTDVGSVLALSGLFLLIYQILIYPSVAKAIEPITLVRATAILTLPLLASYPFMTTLSGFNLQLVVNCASSLKNSFQVTTITVCNILMNDAVFLYFRPFDIHEKTESRPKSIGQWTFCNTNVHLQSCRSGCCRCYIFMGSKAPNCFISSRRPPCIFHA
ncbi:unnamed protein product [Triticum turgidum subsp. durum]|uniref:Uncharacterized protein n=2 Tax=Triticum TaxID=4564 RepID=A0A9R1QG47_TRITD|nr:unnamed protein product [Triticum turgidum subsp. durum]